MSIRPRFVVPLAVAALIAVPAVASSAPKKSPAQPVTRIGAMVNGVKKLPMRIKVARKLGVDLVRPNAEAIGQTTPSQSVFKHHFASLDMFLTVTYKPLGKGKPASPPTDLAAYAKGFGQTLDATTVKLVAVENEELAPKFYSGTSAQYLAQLEAAVKVAHARGVKVTNGGIVASGVVLAAWHDFWKRGQYRLADDYIKLAAVALRTNVTKLLADMPSAADPSKPIFAATPKFATLLKSTEDYLAGFRKSRMDYVNFHWYQAGAKPLGQSIRFLEQTTGKKAVTNEIGQFDQLPSTVTSLLGETRARHLPYVIWYAADGKPAQGLYDAAGVLRPNGIAFRNFVKKHGGG